MEKLPNVEHHQDDGEININSLDYKLLQHDKINEIIDFVNKKEPKSEKGEKK